MIFFPFDLTLNFFIDSNGFSLLFVEVGFFFFCFFFFLFFLILSPVICSTRFSWMFALLISIVFSFFMFLNTLDGLEFTDNGIYFSGLNQCVKILSFVVVIGMSLAGLGLFSSVFTFEYVMLVLFSQSAGLFILSTDHLPLIFILIEIQALIGYTLVVYRRKSQSTTEAGMKYFLLGSVSSSLMVFGIALLYGSFGSFYLTDLALSFDTFLTFFSNVFEFSLFGSVLSSDVFGLDLRILGGVCFLLGLMFKLSVAPLHFWTPEVYENVEFLTVAYFSTIPKLSILALLTGQACFLSVLYRELFLVTGILSLVVGSVSGLFQDSLKKILAYSTITNSGYLFIILSSKGGLDYYSYNNHFVFDVSSGAIWSQMGIYVLTFVALTGFLQFIAEGSEFDSLLSLTYTSLFSRFCFLVLLISLSGIPPTAGFFAKFLLLYVVGDNPVLGISIMFASVLTLFYYLRIAGTIFFYTREHEFFTPVEESSKNESYFLNLFFFPVSFLNLGIVFLMWFLNFNSALFFVSTFLTLEN